MSLTDSVSIPRRAIPVKGAPKGARKTPPIAVTTATKGKGPSLKRELQRLRARKLFLLLSETFQAMGDASRVQVVWALSRGELCVGDLARLLEMSQPSVSHHLRTLRNLKLVKVRRDGRTSYYTLDDDHIEGLLREGIEHVEDLIE